MNCPFCHSPQAATARACRVCGGPLRAPKPKIAPIPLVASEPIPVELARRTFDESAAKLVAANFLRDENPRVCLVRSNGVVQLWNLENGEISSFSVARMFRKFSPLCCALAAPGFVATGHQNGQVRWHDFDGRERKSPASHVGRVLALASSATHFYSGGSDGVIWATALETRQKSRVLLEGLGAMTTFAAAPDAKSIAVGCDDGAVQLWRANADKTSFQLDWTRRGHHAPIHSLSFSANGQMLISRDKNGGLGLWAAQTSYQLPLASGAQCSHVAPAFSSDNRRLAIAGANNGVSIYDVALGTLICEIAPLDEPIAHLAFATGATWLLAAGAREIVVWKI